MNQEIYRRRHSKSKEHVHILSSLTLIGKLTRSEVMKDSVEVEALNEALNRTDTPNTSKESQLARLYYRNGKIIINK
jgi:type II secretory pathway component GspD/PulD (secretin)